MTKKSVLFEELFALTGKRGGRDRVWDTGRSAQLQCRVFRVLCMCFLFYVIWYKQAVQQSRHFLEVTELMIKFKVSMIHILFFCRTLWPCLFLCLVFAVVFHTLG